MKLNSKFHDKFSTYAILTFLSVLMGAPLLFIVSIALASDETTYMATFTLIPKEFHFENFVRVFQLDLNFLKFTINSLILVIFSIIGQVVSSSMVAYGFARLRGPGKNVLFLILLSTMMIPGEVTMIPSFVIFKYLGWINTMLPLIIPNFFTNAFNVFLLRQFISRIPVELDEAAQMDGLGFFGIFVRIILPLIKPALIAIAIFTFTWNWGWFMGPLIYINDVDKSPLALGVQILSATSSSGQVPPWNLVSVGSLLLTLPMLIVYFFGQKYLDEFGLMSGGSVGIK
jgi:multiple sugar transport system permease protein